MFRIIFPHPVDILSSFVFVSLSELDSLSLLPSLLFFFFFLKICRINAEDTDFDSWHPDGNLSLSLQPNNVSALEDRVDRWLPIVTVLANTGYTQKNGAVSLYSPLKPHHSFVYTLYSNTITASARMVITLNC